MHKKSRGANGRNKKKRENERACQEVPDSGAQKINAKKIGIVSRTYRKGNAVHRDVFLKKFGDIVRRLDENGCDTALFSLWTFRKKVHLTFPITRNIRTIIIEDCGTVKVLQKSKEGENVWKVYSFKQQMGTRDEMPDDFVKCHVPKGILDP